MTRPRVDPEKRQRTACACDSCKRRKQKCNGEKPCNTCTKRRLQCEYTPTNTSEASQSPVASPKKRRHVDTSPRTLKSSLDDLRVQQSQDEVHHPGLVQWDSADMPAALGLIKSELSQLKAPRATSGSTRRHFASGEYHDSDSRSRMSNSGGADEAEGYSFQRMLQDSTGRLLYIGDSATLSYLQLIRMIVDQVAGQSAFTLDPKRHMIQEAQMSLPPAVRPTGVLPDRRTANILVESYFTNTIGLIEVFDKSLFLESVNECYNNPLGVSPSMLCLLYLVFAIGLVIAKPLPGSEDEVIIKRLRSEEVNRAELFYRNSKSLADPISGFEDADFWSIQALLLMSIYMLSVAKRNASYAYYGMAVRTAFALGLHREESMNVFSEIEQRVRRNLWRTLFILDRFLAASLGRPAAISEDDCSEHALDPFLTPAALRNSADQTSSAALDAAVRTCQVVGLTLKNVYSKRKTSTTVAQEIADELEDWNEQLDPALHWKDMMSGPIDPSAGIANLHINLLHCHAIMLLTRPFFLYILTEASQEWKHAGTYRSRRISRRMETFAQACVEASQHTLFLAHAALNADYLPQRDPFVIYFVFAAGLIVLSNEFASLYHNPDADKAIQSCIAVLEYCAENDPQAERVSYIVHAFNGANRTRPLEARLSLRGRKVPSISSSFRSPEYDPMAHFFHHDEHGTRGAQLPPLAPTPKHDHSILSAGLPPSSMSSHSSTNLPSVMQQPSPDGSGTSPVNSGVISASGIHSMDAINGPEAEFDFDSLWPNWSGQVSHPAAQPAGNGFDTYGLGPPPQMAHLGHERFLNANVNVPLYPSSDFR